MANKNRRCAITSCVISSKTNPDEKFVLFPKYGTERFYLWLKKTNLNLEKGIHVLCKRHFTPDCFDGKERLKRNVFPSLNLLNNNPSSSVIFFSPKSYTKTKEGGIVDNLLIKDEYQNAPKDLEITHNINENLNEGSQIKVVFNSCLVCLQNVGVLSIYTEEERNISLAEQIKMFADITIKSDGGFPNSVCLECVVKINDCYKLKQQLIDSINILTNMRKNCDQIDNCESDISCAVHEDEHSLNENKNNQFCSVFFPDVKVSEKEESLDDIKEESPVTISDEVNQQGTDKKNGEVAPSVIVGYKTCDCSLNNCNECGKVFQTNKTLAEHKILHTDETPYECDKCNKKFQQKAKLMSHQRWHKQEKKYICEICSRQYKSIQSLNHHKLIHGEPKYKCNECEKVFHTPNGVRDHAKRHAQKKQGITYSCDKCDKTLSCKAALIMHQKSIHLGIKLYKCVICDKEYFNSYNFQFHVRRHTGEKPYSCEVCDEKFAQRPILTRHLEKKHNIKRGTKNISNIDRANLQCQMCKKQLSCLQKFTEHMRIHSGEKPYECKYCKKSFRVSQALVCHTRIHTGEKPFQCKYCPGKFKTLSHSIQHERQHTGIKPYKCSICHKAFSNSGYLKIHTRVHSGEKPYECPHCEKTFTTTGNRDAHIRVHTGEKPYSCKQCDAEFIRLKYLKHHIEKEHPQNNIQLELENEGSEADTSSE